MSIEAAAELWATLALSPSAAGLRRIEVVELVANLEQLREALDQRGFIEVVARSSLYS